MSGFRYRLSTFLAFVTLVAVGCWWYTSIRPVWVAESSLKELMLLQANQLTAELAWGSEMRKLIEVGPKSLPVLIRSLDATPVDDRLSLRTIPYAMRCIDDPRAVPSLIRAIPRCLGRDGSDWGFSIGDPELAEFLAEKHGDTRVRSLDYGRPVNEVFGALEHLTGQSFDHMELAFVTEEDYDTKRQTQLKRQLYDESAYRWAEWWEGNWREFTKDPHFAKVGLPAKTERESDRYEVEIDETVERFYRNSFQGIIIQPVCAQSDRVCFLDLDTNRLAILPNRFEHVMDPVDVLPDDVLEWASVEGFDIYGAVIPSNDEEGCFVIRTIDTRVYEVGQERQSMTLAFAIREGNPVGNVIAHMDKDTQETKLESTGDFVFITNEDTVGRIALGFAVASGRSIGWSYLIPKP